MMQKIPLFVHVFYVGVAQSCLTLLLLLLEFAVSGESKFRLFSLELEQFLLCLLIGIINVFQMTFKTMAYQNERPAFIALIGYIGLVYGFLVDVFYRDEAFSAWQLIGVVIIVAMCILIVCTKPKPVPQSTKEPEIVV